MDFLPFYIYWILGGDLSSHFTSCGSYSNGEQGICVSERSCTSIAKGINIGYCETDETKNICCKIPDINSSAKIKPSTILKENKFEKGETKSTRNSSDAIQTENYFTGSIKIPISSTPIDTIDKNYSLSLWNIFAPIVDYRNPVEVEESHDMRTPIEVEVDQNMRRPVELEVDHNMRKPVEVEVDHNMRKPVEIEVDHNMRKPVEVGVNHNLRKPVEVKMNHNLRKPIEVEVNHNLRRPIEEEANHNLRTPVEVEVNHNLRRPRPVEVEVNHDLRRPVTVEVNHDLRRPVAVEVNHDLRRPVEVEVNHDLRIPVEVEINHDLRIPVKVGANHDMRKPILPNESHDLRWPVLDEYTHDLRTPFLGHDTETHATEIVIIGKVDKPNSKEDVKTNIDNKFEMFYKYPLDKISGENNDYIRCVENSSSTHKNISNLYMQMKTAEDKLYEEMVDTSSKVCGRPQTAATAKLVGGTLSVYLQWPWMVSLRQRFRNNMRHKCGATLLNNLWVITAAHCVDLVPKWDFALRLGDHNLNKKDEPHTYVVRYIDRIIKHQKFNPTTYENDIALLLMNSPVEFRPNIIPVCLPKEVGEIEGRISVVLGWGKVKERGYLSGLLQELNLPVLSNRECEEMYRKVGFQEEIKDVFVCAGTVEGGMDTCDGDSGGPMLILDSQERWALIGLVSWGKVCGAPSQPGVYTRITEYIDWIDGIIACYISIKQFE